MVAIEATREAFGEPTDTKPVICSCAPGRTRKVRYSKPTELQVLICGPGGLRSHSPLVKNHCMNLLIILS